LANGADRRLDQIIKMTLKDMDQSTPRIWSPCDTTADRRDLPLCSLLDLLVARNGLTHCLFPMQELWGWDQAMNVSSDYLL
jgi:hypothetical protein